MQHFYDGQIRRYLLQVIRLLSNFVVKYGDGTLVRIPVVYGDSDRQAANIVSQNSQNTILSAPRIAVYITGLELDINRLADATYVGKVHIRERDIDDNGNYTSTQGNNYTVERLMPTPYKLTFKVDIWSSSTDQKLQILEQILMLFNPSLEIQTTDNYVDWTSLSVVDLTEVTFSSRTIPVGTNADIDIATLGLSTPIWISPPAKVKRLGVTTSIISNILGGIYGGNDSFIEGLGSDNNMSNSELYGGSNITSHKYTVGNFDIEVGSNGIIRLTSASDPGNYLSWQVVIQQNPESYKPGLTKLFLRQPDGTYVVGYVTINPLDDTMLVVNWDGDSFPSNTAIPGPARPEADWGYFDAIIDPQRTGPNAGLPAAVTGIRYLILEDIGGGYKDTFTADHPTLRINTNVLHSKVYDHKVFVDGVEVGSGSLRIPDQSETGNYYITLDDAAATNSEITYILEVNEDGADAWKNTDDSDFIAGANDLIEWDGTKWNVVFSAKESADLLVYQMNIFTKTQYKWNGVSWSKSFEGDYRRGDWRFEL